MLKVIEPQIHELHGPLLDSLLGLLKIYQGFYLSPEQQDKATFLIPEDDKRGVYGGAVLYTQKISPSLDLAANDTRDETLGKMFSAFQPKVKAYWTARICLCIGQDPSTPHLETIELYENFYKNLYKAFTEFGEKKETEYLTFTFQATGGCTDNTLSALLYKNWPYLLEARPSESPDGYVHGILSLKGNKFKARRNPRSSLSSHSSTEMMHSSREVRALEGRIG
jgi:hypothetical protein